MIKNIWNWVAWQFYKGNAKGLLATSTELVKRMDSRQKLACALNAVQVGSRLWTGPLTGIASPQVLILDVKGFIESSDKRLVVKINYRGDEFKSILTSNKIIPAAWDKLPKGFSPDYSTPANKELAYAFWSLTRMLAIVYPMHGLEYYHSPGHRCDDSEALTRIATSAVTSVAAAYGHAHGVRAYGRKYREMIEYGRELNG